LLPSSLLVLEGPLEEVEMPMLISPLLLLLLLLLLFAAGHTRSHARRWRAHLLARGVESKCVILRSLLVV
jgi:hypothetical protein